MRVLAAIAVGALITAPAYVWPDNVGVLTVVLIALLVVPVGIATWSRK